MYLVKVDLDDSFYATRLLCATGHYLPQGDSCVRLPSPLQSFCAAMRNPFCFPSIPDSCWQTAVASVGTWQHIANFQVVDVARCIYFVQLGFRFVCCRESPQNEPCHCPANVKIFQEEIRKAANKSSTYSLVSERMKSNSRNPSTVQFRASVVFNIVSANSIRVRICDVSCVICVICATERTKLQQSYIFSISGTRKRLHTAGPAATRKHKVLTRWLDSSFCTRLVCCTFPCCNLF